jgi:guanylate kinase
MKPQSPVGLQNDLQIIVFTAPSGAGKTTCRNHALKTQKDLEFSISSCTRQKRSGDVHGVDYYFVTLEKFKEDIKNDAFLEFEEVYPGKYYGTLKSEIERIHKNYHHVLLDIDVKGAQKVKKIFPHAKIIFIKPPSLEVLAKRLQKRGDTSPEDMKVRIAQAKEELSFGERMCQEGIFTVSLVNNEIEQTQATLTNLLNLYLGRVKSA